MKKKISLLFVLIIVFLVAYRIGLFDLLTLEAFQENRLRLEQFQSEHKILFIFAYFLIYILVTALSLPGAAVMTLAGGTLFGFFEGLVIVSFASSIGATVAFLVSRFLLRDFVKNKFSTFIKQIDEGIKKEGAFYLFSVRLIPIFPFFLINLVMGLTAMRVWVFYSVSQLGMLLGTAAYVNAGTQLGQIHSLGEILSLKVFFSFVLLGLLPLFSKGILNRIKKNKIFKNYKKPKSFDYNLVVIGGGSAGLVSSYIASAVKAKVAIIEKNKMGGDCLNFGCVPSKALLKTAKMIHGYKRYKEFGLSHASVDYSFSDVMKRVQNVIGKIAPHDSIERYTSLGVECFEGEAKILSPYEVRIGDRVLTTKKIIVATGAHPLVPPFKGLNEIKYYTSDTIWSIESLPKKLIVLGGGPIGCELAQAFLRLGSQVTLVEMSDLILSKEDEEVSRFVQKQFENEGMQVLTGHRAVEFKMVEFQQKLVVQNKEGSLLEISFDATLIVLGRQARVQGFGLEELGVEVSKKGTLLVNEYMQTSIPNIYACGDVVGPYQFTHMAAHQAWYASVNALFPLKKFRVDYRVVPWCTFTEPEVAQVGLNERMAKEGSVDYEVTRYDIDDLDRAIAEGEAYGWIKVLTQPKSDKILGVTIVGYHAGELIAEYVMAMKHRIGLNKVLGTIHIYPTLTESNKYVAGQWKKNHAPTELLKWVEKFHKLMRRF